jgi:hypothetical protein
MDRETAQEMLNHELDGRLSAAEARALGERLAADPALARERAELQRLEHLLGASRIGVVGGFRRRVMESLPAAGWEARHPRSWRFAVALLVLLGGASAALVGAGSARLAPGGSLVGALVAVADLFKAAALAGGGLVAASWKGLGLALGELVAGSPAAVAVFALLVLSLNLLLVALLRGSARAARVPVERERGGEPRR